MIEKKFYRRLLLSAVAAISLLTMVGRQDAVSAESEENDWSAEVLMQMLAEVREADLTFVEQRSSAFLVGEIELKGTLKYIAPDFIEKRVETPYIHKIKINGDKLSVEKTTNRGETSTQQYSLSSSESLRTMVEGFRATLAGNLAVLIDNYHIALEGDMLGWMVTLTPKKPELLDHIEKIALAGAKREIRTIETVNADGDVSRLLLSYQMIK